MSICATCKPGPKLEEACRYQSCWRQSYWYQPEMWRTDVKELVIAELEKIAQLLVCWSHLTSKCGKNKEVAHEPQASVLLMFLSYFDVLCDLLLHRPTSTWNLFVLYNNQKRKTTGLPRIAWLYEDMCQFRSFPSHKCYFSSLLLLFFFTFLVDGFSETFYNAFTC